MVMRIVPLSQYNYRQQDLTPAFHGINMKALIDGLAAKAKAGGAANSPLSQFAITKLGTIMTGAVLAAAKANDANLHKPTNTVCSPGTIQETKSPLED